jgi:molecular chaperone Hsp33
MDEDGDDLLVRAIARGPELRIVAAVTTRLVGEAARRHATSAPATVALGRALTSSLLLATMAKGDERVTLQLVGDGPLRGLTADASADGSARGYVREPAALAPTGPPDQSPRLQALVGRQGVVNVVRDLGLRELYQGQVELTSGEIDEDVEAYLRRSEQVPSALSCDVLLDPHGGLARAAGVLVQAMPGGDGEIVGRAVEGLRRGALYDLLRAGPTTAHAIAERLSPVQPIEFLADRPLRFQCRCSAERVRNTLRMLPTADLDEMIAEGHPASVTCNFCNDTTTVGLDELREIRAAVGGARASN